MLFNDLIKHQIRIYHISLKISFVFYEHNITNQLCYMVDIDTSVSQSIKSSYYQKFNYNIRQFSFQPFRLATQLRSSKYHMAQSRKRIFVVMIRADVCGPTYAQQLGRIITEVLPHATYNENGGALYRENIQDLRAYTQKILAEMEREPTTPPISQDWDFRKNYTHPPQYRRSPEVTLM